MAGAPDSPGIASMVFRHVFADAAGRQHDAEAPLIKLSIMEIYKEVVYDLLNDRARVELKTGKAATDAPSSSASGSGSHRSGTSTGAIPETRGW